MQSKLDVVLEALPGVSRTVREQGGEMLGEYLASHYRRLSPSLQSRDDLADIAGAYAGRLLGAQTGALVAQHMADTPVVITANHHGIDFLAQSVQGTLLSALPKVLGLPGTGPPVVPVVACGSVPLSSFSYPRGVAFSTHYRSPSPGGPEAAVSPRIPVFSSRARHTLACAAPAFTSEMVGRAHSTAARLLAGGGICKAAHDTAQDVLATVYGAPEILALACYSDQAVVANARNWPRLFAPQLRADVPPLAYLELERLAGALIRRDLRDDDSLMKAALFDAPLRRAVQEQLDGSFGCWDANLLDALCGNDAPAPGTEDMRGAGTAFFWGLDDGGRRMPLCLGTSQGRTALFGNGLSGQRLELPWHPAALEKALEQGRIIPCLFTSYACLACARGVVCQGGVFQTDYLPAMGQGLARALESVGRADDAARVRGVATANFVAGPAFCLGQHNGEPPAAAGSVEMMAGGGLTQDSLESVAALSLLDGLHIGLAELYAEFSSPGARQPGWFAAMGTHILDTYAERIALMHL